MMPKQKKSLAVAAIGLYGLALAAVVIRSFLQAKCRRGVLLAVLVIAGCGPWGIRAQGMGESVAGSRMSAPLGADFSSLSKAAAAKMGISGGVVVVKIHAGGTLSNQTKMREGFVITRIGDVPVTTVEELTNAVSRQKVSYQIQGVYPGSKQVVYYSIHDF
ncbi:MAG: hypothetical protein JST68_26590 [Bacteroidetes bacterium]|nr:hypothetical protein [Bacteroidota bacterium]